MRLLSAVAICALSVALCSNEAGADWKDEVNPPPTQQDDGDVVIVVGTDGSISAPSSGGGGGSELECTVWVTAPSFETPFEDRVLEPAEAQEGAFYYMTCTNADGEIVVERFIVWDPGNTVITPESLAREARELLEIGVPEPRTSPRRSVDQIVGIETWMWLDPSTWEPASETASVPGLSVTARAEPTSVTWDMGDGAVVTCDGPGTPYDFDRPSADQSTECSHLYQVAGAYAASATVTWTVSWSAADGAGGDLADVERTTDFPMAVVERQAVGR